MNHGSCLSVTRSWKLSAVRGTETPSGLGVDGGRAGSLVGLRKEAEPVLDAAAPAFLDTSVDAAPPEDSADGAAAAVGTDVAPGVGSSSASGLVPGLIFS